MSHEIFTPIIDAALHCQLFLLREFWPKVSYYIVSLFIRSTFITLIQNKPFSNCIEHEYEQFIFFLTIFASCKIKQHCVAGLDVPHLHTNLTWFHPIVQRFQHFRLSVASPFFVHLFGLQCLHAAMAKLWGEVMACAEIKQHELS